MNDLLKGEQYNVETIHLIRWSGENCEGYFLSDFFDEDGTYKGADKDGVEPIVLQMTLGC